MSKPKVFFRADANSKIGMGHLVRSSALAKMLESDFEITFLIQDTPAEVQNKILKSFHTEEIKGDELLYYRQNIKKGILVLDGYQFDSDYQEQIRKSGIKSVIIDDLHNMNYSTDVIINQADSIKASDYKAKIETKFYLGPDYALLRPPFIKAASEKRESLKKINSVFVSFGGADAYNVSEKAIEALLDFDQVKQIHVLSGPVNKNSSSVSEKYKNELRTKFYHDLDSESVCELMKKCELALVPSSSLSLEICSVGMVMITGTTAGNQEGYYMGLMQRSAALGLGDWLTISAEAIKDKIRTVLVYDEKDISWFIKNQRAYIDGKSGERLKNVFLNLAI